jgi:hypothetical protein
MEAGFCVEALEEAIGKHGNLRFSTATRAVRAGLENLDRSISGFSA